jgi:hypothetical protein
VISVYLVVALALGVAGYQAMQGAWIEATGLAALGVGRLLVHVSKARPALKPVAWFCFGICALAVALVVMR